MTFPAWFDFTRDPVMLRHPATLAVYAAIIQRPRCFHDPQEVKAWLMADELGFEKETVLKALNLLVERGYLQEHERAQNNIRRFTVAAYGRGETPPPTIEPEIDPQILARRRLAQNVEHNARRARIMQAGGKYTIGDVRTQHDQQGGRCYYCAVALGTSYHIEHKTPLSRGGTNGPENICLSCAPCNLRKSTKTAEEFKAS